jgi:hypothetical protein
MQSHRSPALTLRHRLARVPALLAALLLAATVVAQPPPVAGLPKPQLTLVFPNGAKVGSVVDIEVTGTDLDDPQGLQFDDPGITAALVAAAPAADPKKPPPKQGPIIPVMTHKFKVTVGPGVPLGLHDLRVVNRFGISNPRVFMVGDLTEVMEKEPNNDVDQAQFVELNTTINGVIGTPTDVDYFLFKGAKGQRVICSCLASSIESRLHPVIEVYEKATGKLLSANRDYHGHDALLDVTLPANGEYHARLFQFTHLRGGTDHYYRLSLSTAPWIDAVFPPMVTPGKATELTFYGRNLPGGKAEPSAVLDGVVLEKATVMVTPPNDPAAPSRLDCSGYLTPPMSGLDGFQHRLRNAAGWSNPCLIGFAQAPAMLDNGTNSARDKAQALTLPCEVAGRLDTPHPQAWYSFAGKKGDIYTIELLADRIGSPIDLSFALYNADTKALVKEEDDDPETLSADQLFTRSMDPARYQLKVAADANYQLLVKSQGSPDRAGPRHLYRLRVSPEQPDFRLVAMPASTSVPEATVLRQGGHQDITVFVWRHDGFDGAIALTMEGLPNGVSCPPQFVGPGLRQVALIVSAAANAAAWNGNVKIKGTATIDGKAVVREARAATISWPLNAQQAPPTFTRLDRSLVLAVRDKAPFVLTPGINKLKASPGDKVTVPIKVQRLWPDATGPVQVVALNLPAGLTLTNNAPLTSPKDAADLVLTVGPNVLPGNYSIAFRGTAQLPFAKDPMAKTKPNVTVALPSAPITITILPKEKVAK